MQSTNLKTFLSTTENVLHDIRRQIHSRIYFDVDLDYRNSVFLAGTGRSGTTWVEEIIDYNHEYRIIFEPFYPQKVGTCQHFRYKQYLRPENNDEIYLAPAREIISGKIRNSWTDRYNKRLIYRKRLIKDIRANLMLKWLHVHFPAMPIIFLFRHPLAVANSRGHKPKWDPSLEHFLTQPELMEDFLEPFRKEIESASTTFEKHIFLWAIENYVPLKQFSSQDHIYITFYENLCIDPESEIRRLFSFLGREFNEQVLNRIHKPSAQIRKGSAILTGEDLISGWKRYISKSEQERAMEILQLFGLDKIYTTELIPTPENVWNL